MAKLRVLWVPPSQREILSGETYTKEELIAAGLNPDKMLAHGEAEEIAVSPKAEPSSKKKGK